MSGLFARAYGSGRRSPLADSSDKLAELVFAFDFCSLAAIESVESDRCWFLKGNPLLVVLALLPLEQTYSCSQDFAGALVSSRVDFFLDEAVELIGEVDIAFGTFGPSVSKLASREQAKAEPATENKWSKNP